MGIHKYKCTMHEVVCTRSEVGYSLPENLYVHLWTLEEGGRVWTLSYMNCLVSLVWLQTEGWPALPDLRT